MLRLTILALFCLTVASGAFLPKPRLDGRIVGGVAVPIEDFKFQVSMHINGGHSCGGSVISNDWILTAAHCTVGRNPSSLKIRAGSKDNRNGGQYVDVERIIVHPQYSSQNIDYDYSLLKLKTQLVFGSTVQKIELHGQGLDVQDGANCTVSGWGNTQSSNEPSNPLRAVNVPKVNQSSCNKAYVQYGGVTDRMICAGFQQGGKDACQGDSGGPLTSDGILVGVVSWGYGCAVKDFPGVYSRVSVVRDWIRQNSGV